MYTFENKKIILASNSPRRQQILKDAFVPFTVVAKNIPEDYPKDLMVETVPLYLAELKANALKDEIKEEIVIASDTVVILNNEILGKPESIEDAIQMISKLNGKMHEVITGVCILSREKLISFTEKSEVYFKKLSIEEIEFYVKSFKPLDKAGSYGIQEWIGLVGIEKINGSFYNVMGLPIHRVYEELRKF